jgi:RNA polymerase sigma-70 factor (ECF subfamily)
MDLDLERPGLNFSEQDDVLILQAVAAGQSSALSTLYDRYGRLVYSLAYNIIQDDGLAEEITQDVFVQVWHKASSYHSDLGKVLTWLSSVARHRAIDILRQRGSRPEGHRLDVDEDSWPELPDDINIESIVEQDQQKQRLLRALAQLPPEQRKALSLAFLKGYTHQEIADLCGEPLGTVKTRIRLAMQKLRQILDER